MQLATFNAACSSFGFLTATFSWASQSLITGTFTFESLLYKPAYQLGRVDPPVRSLGFMICHVDMLMLDGC